ncbi:MAG: type II toxin-antitoxin system YafQ family toxin [Synergistaceae bacterium]|nr:type II toxin-antitoxin system YafQ family toxin [Synergistaceae bacterium]
MRRVVESSPYRKDVKRTGKGIHSKVLEEELPAVIDALANDRTLEPKYRDHPLHGALNRSRDCHIKPDFVLVYTYLGDNFLRLERLGTHADIFGL